MFSRTNAKSLYKSEILYGEIFHELWRCTVINHDIVWEVGKKKGSRGNFSHLCRKPEYLNFPLIGNKIGETKKNPVFRRIYNCDCVHHLPISTVWKLRKVSPSIFTQKLHKINALKVINFPLFTIFGLVRVKYYFPHCVPIIITTFLWWRRHCVQKQKFTVTFNFFREIKVQVNFHQAVDFTEICQKIACVHKIT